MKLNIPFIPFFAGSMLSGHKTVTSRTKRYGKEGDTFQAFGATFKIIRIRKFSLKTIANYFYGSEGCTCPEHFKLIWRHIHPGRGFDPQQKVYAHFFIKVGLNHEL